MNKVLILTVSASGSGKSFLAENLRKEGYVVCCADDYMMINGSYVFNKDKLGYAHRMCQTDAFLACSFGKNVIVSNTNSKWADIKYYVELGVDHNYIISFDFFSFNIPDDLVIPWLAKRNVHAVPEETIRKQFENCKNLKGSLRERMTENFPNFHRWGITTHHVSAMVKGKYV